MLNQKIQNPNPDELMIEVDLCYELDPYELKLDEMIEAEPEPEMIEGLPASDALTPADRYLELFEHVQSAKIFPDSKTFPDCAPKMDPLDILIRYRKVRRHRDFDLRKFVENHFWLPEVYSSEYVSDPQNSLKEHIDQLWPVLTREPQDHIPWSSLLALPQSYIVPGGRFSETYYWDSYFTMLGLAESGREDLLKCMADNFAWMIENYGHIPNGNRTYYLSRSQPPVFALMVELFEEDGVRGARRYLDHLKMEYAFWMDGAESLIPNQAYRHVVRMPDGSLLNRYWDDRDTPRDESWLEDVETAKHSGRPPNEVYRDLRAGAASGWDYSSRWLRDTGRLASIRTTQFIPIDLNAFLFKLESAIANISALKGEKETEALFRQKASARRDAVNRYLWDDENGIYRDYDWRREQLALFSAAAIVPLYVGMANHEQADRLANAVRSRLLTPGGILASEYETGEQWDKPNGWAPLQWMAIQGFKMYGDDLLGALYGSFPQLGAPIGFFFANGTFLLLSWLLTDEQFMSWGWRVPFIFSAVLVIIGLYVRVSLHESPVFEKVAKAKKQVKIPLGTLLTKHVRVTVLGTFIMLATYTLFYIMTVYSMTFSTAAAPVGLGLPRNEVLWMLMMAVIGFAVMVPLAGLLADAFGRRKSMVVITTLIILFALFAFNPLLGSGNPALVFVFLLLGLSLMGLTFGPMGALLPELFPTEVRYTGASFSYNVSSILGASVAPYIAAWLQTNYGLGAVGLYLAAMAGLTLIALLLTHETRHQSL